MASISVETKTISQLQTADSVQDEDMLLVQKADGSGTKKATIADVTGGGGGVPIATTSIAGKVKPDGTTISVGSDGTITVIGGGGGFPSVGNAGFHNSIYRGQSLGTEVTSEQYAAISAGTFDDMYIGDYWTINGTVYRIAAFDYWLHCGDTECTTHHIVLVPDENMYTAKMNDSNATTGAYVGSAMYTTNLNQAKTTINTDFGSAHILSHREYLPNAMKATSDPTYESSGSWYDSTVELMNERMIYGADAFHNVEVNGAIPTNYTIDKSQLPLFALEPGRITNRAHWWLRDAVSAAYFALVGSDGYCNCNNASRAYGVRPAFGIIA